MEEVRRTDDGELCGHVVERDGRWTALVVFGAPLGEHATRDDAVGQVLAEGLGALADRWTLQRDGHDDEVVCIVEANADAVTLALGYYSMPGVPTVRIPAAEIRSGAQRLVR